jgi:hypothetical protein
MVAMDHDLDDVSQDVGKPKVIKTYGGETKQQINGVYSKFGAKSNNGKQLK